MSSNSLSVSLKSIKYPEGNTEQIRNLERLIHLKEAEDKANLKKTSNPHIKAHKSKFLKKIIDLYTKQRDLLLINGSCIEILYKVNKLSKQISLNQKRFKPGIKKLKAYKIQLSQNMIDGNRILRNIKKLCSEIPLECDYGALFDVSKIQKIMVRITSLIESKETEGILKEASQLADVVHVELGRQLSNASSNNSDISDQAEEVQKTIFESISGLLFGEPRPEGRKKKRKNKRKTRKKSKSKSRKKVGKRSKRSKSSKRSKRR